MTPPQISEARLTQPRNASDPAQKDDVCAGPRANDVAPDDPNHSISGVNMQSMEPPRIPELADNI